MTPPETPTCTTCAAPIAAVEAEVDPQAITYRFRAQCSHLVAPDVAHALWEAHGYRWTLPAIDAMSLGAAERRRHLAEEGYTPAHDAEHASGGELAWASWCYVDRAVHDTGAATVEPPTMWPWGRDAWKAEATPERRLVIAIALLGAELDRRLAKKRIRGQA